MTRRVAIVFGGALVIALYMLLTAYAYGLLNDFLR